MTPHDDWAFPPLPHVEAELANGLRVVAVQAPSVPLTEIRLRLPLDPGRTDPATAQVLAATLLPGPLVGGAETSFSAEADGRAITVAGTVSSGARAAAMDALPAALTAPRYAEEACRVTARALASRAGLLRANPTALALEQLRAHLHGDGYRSLLPDEHAFAAVTVDAVTRLHTTALAPDRALLLLVGALNPERALREVAATWSTWPSTDTRPTPTPPNVSTRRHPRPGLRFVPRPGAEQTQILLAAPVPGPADPRFPAVALACCVLGGSFSARLAAALRDGSGLAYQVQATLAEHAGDQVVLVQADTATGTTEAAVRALRAELRRLRDEPPAREEIDSARAFVVGTVLRTAASQAGLADHLAGALEHGSVPEALHGFVAALSHTDEAAVLAAVSTVLAPERFTGVIVGDPSAETLEQNDHFWRSLPHSG